MEAQKNVLHGIHPPVPKELQKSRHPIDIALGSAMNMCFIYDPKNRSSAMGVSQFLREAADRLRF